MTEVGEFTVTESIPGKRVLRASDPPWTPRLSMHPGASVSSAIAITASNAFLRLGNGIPADILIVYLFYLLMGTHGGPQVTIGNWAENLEFQGPFEFVKLGCFCLKYRRILKSVSTDTAGGFQ